MTERIAIIGTCQTPVIAACLKALSPRANIDVFYLNKLPTEQLRVDAAVALSRYDLILSQSVTHARFAPLTQKALKQRFSNVVFFPQIIFRGFHPDDYYIEYEGRRWMSPIDNHHSLLLGAAFRMKIAPERAVNLFNAYVFARLGYFDEYQLAKSNLVMHASGLGYDISSSIDDWKSAGAFMHLPTHPTLRVLSDIAQKIAVKAAIPISGSTEYLVDITASGLSLPVYPGLAKRLGVSGSTRIKLAAPKGESTSASLSLEEYVNESYRIYATYPKEIFETPRIKAIQAILREDIVFA
jgi:hypothetical protein